MPRPMVPRARGFEAADALLAEGKEPTLILIKERIGGGSFSTIQPYLSAWFEQRKAQQIAVPEDILGLGRDYVRKLWVAALNHDDGRIAQVRAEAQHQVEDVKARLAESEEMIKHLERDNEDHQRQVDEAHATIEALHAQLAEARSAAEVAGDKLAEARTAEQVAQARATELERQVVNLREELDQADERSSALAEIQRQLTELNSRVLEEKQRGAGGT